MTSAKNKSKQKYNANRKKPKRKKNYSLVEADFTLIATTIALVIIGLLMVYSATSYENIALGKSAYKDVFKQGLFALIGIFLMIFVISNIDYHNYTRQLSTLLLILTIGLNLLVLRYDPIKNARRWIHLPMFSFQPSEIAKFMVVVFNANILKRIYMHRKKPWGPVVKVFFTTGILAGIIVIIQSNLSVGAIIGLTSMVMIFLSGASYLQSFIPIILGGAAFTFAILKKPYRLIRVTSFLKPFEDPRGSGHQLVQSLYALSSGGIFGRGLAMSRLKAFWLPEAHNDFIFAVIVEELGFLGGMLVIILLITLVYKGMRISIDARDNFGRLLAAGITAVFAFQSLINIAVVIGAFPVTGVTLPFISAGGTSLIVNLAAVGVLLNISRQKPKDN